MAATSSERLELYEKMKASWGERPAATFMEIIPPMDVSEIATKADIENATVFLRGEMTELRAELRGDMAALRAELRGDMTELRTELRGEMTELRSELRGEMAGLRGELLAEFGALRGELRASTRHSIITIVAAAITIWLSFYVPHVL